MDISGKTAIVTGAASGIGLGIATALAEAGANVVMTDIQQDAVEEAAHGLSGTNKRVMPLRIDVTQEQSVLDALAEAERNFGKLHIACNNAGVPMHGTRLVDVPRGDWEFVIGVNIWGVIHGIRHFVPAILKHGEEGHIVNTASVAGFQNRRSTGQGPYSMSKYAVLSLSEALEHELESTNVGVSVLCPGPIATNIARGARNRPDHMGGPQRGSASASWTRSVPRRSMPLSAPFPPKSSKPVTAASRTPSTARGLPTTSRFRARRRVAVAPTHRCYLPVANAAALLPARRPKTAPDMRPVPLA